DQAEDAKLWGLKPKMDDQGQPEPLIIPPGLVMPRFEEATLNRILVRPGEYADSGKDALIEDSEETPLFLPSVDPEGAPVIRVADELEAWLVEQEIGDACSVIALQNPEEKPDKDAAKNIEDASVFLVVLPEKPAESEKDWEFWKKAYPNAQKLYLPKGNTVFEARKHGTDIRKWIMEALPSDFVQKHQIEPVMPEPGKPPEKSPMAGLAIPALDIKGMVDKFTKEIRAFHQPKIDEAMAMKKIMEGQARDAILKAGKDPDPVLSAAKDPPAKSLSKVGDEMAQKITEERERIRAAGHLTPEIESKMNTAAAKAAQMGRDGEKQYQEGMAKIAAGKKEIAQAKAGGIPDSLKGKFDKAGIDPEKIKKLTREEVIERYEKGENIAGAILSGLDLSKLDLHGIDLSTAQCLKTKFCESNLDGAIFNQTLAQEADFSRASLRNIKSEKGIFKKALFKEANLANADIDSAILQEADLTKANCAGAKFNMTILQKARLNQTSLAGADANMSVFSDADASDADFGRIKLFKCLFQKTILDRADFSGAVVNSTMFNGARGEKVKFTGADMSKARMGGNAVFPGADFRNIKMVQGCFRDSDLSGADFRGSTLGGSILENCNLEKADFFRVSAKKCRFSKSNLENANLAGVNLFMGSLRKARLVNTDLSNSNLFAVDFYKAMVGETNFDEANLKMSQLHNRTDLLD
ncbi:MAG: pentapeptide repeat-containing protein, partial [Deltaproteobacteria bacterium]|nr:pentapeptide repeat-containing protein [Deltaproteobacteria bacterium]